MIYQNASEYARSNNVSKQRVMEWIGTGRLSAWRPAPRVYLIDAKAPRPEPGKTGRPTNYVKENGFKLTGKEIETAIEFIEKYSDK